MNSIDPKDLIIHVNDCPPVAQKGYKVGIDTEFFHMEKSKLHRPCGVFAGMGATYDGKEVWIITDETVIPDFMYQIDAGVHVYHNSLFDIRQIRRYCDYPDRTRLWDTMVLEQIMYAGWYSAGEFALGDLSRRYLDLYMDKSVREEFETSDTMSREQIEYLAVDIVTTWRVYQEQKKVADENDLNVWKNIDRPAIYSLLKMRGMKLDVVEWNKLYEFNMAEAERIRAKYEGINLGSWQQVLKRLKADGFKVDSTNEKALTAILGESEFARDVLEYRGRVKAAGTYGMKWVEEFVEPDGRIYSSFYVNGSATGRFSSSNPNVENIPVRDGPQFRKCFVADEGNVLVDADFSAQEPRIWAYLAQDEQLIDIFKQKLDIYIESARKMFGWELTKSDPLRKTRMKPTVLGAIFGLTEYGLLNKDQIPLEEGKELLDAFWKTYHSSRDYADDIRQTKDYVQTVYGRKYWINPYQNGHENNCLNSPVQGTGGDILKISGYCFQQMIDAAGYGDRVWIINYVHDEILVEGKKELLPWIVETLRNCMVSTAERTHEGVPADVEISSGDNWAEAH